ncbi:MAG: hypothetical protein JWO19_3157 [Bryobacterales bacterium]|nr:hypothetical protein [Bryobacterales bacterium]
MLPLARTPATAQGQIEVTGKIIVPPGAAAPKALPPAGPKGPVPRMPDGKPDFSGIWNGQRALPNQELPAMLPWADKLTKERTENYSADDPEARCLPGGVPRAAPYHYQLVQTPKLLLMLFEGNIHSFRQMFLDRREHPRNIEPMWYGDSIGSWEGDTLVVDTVGFNDKFWFDMAGHPHTTQLHVIERYHRRDFGNLDIGITIQDPGTYTKPWVIQRVSTLETGMEMSEYVCNENNSDVLHLVGK